MENEFWRGCWQDNRIFFHQNQVQPYLKKYWKLLNLAEGEQCFVPLCGKTLDMLFLAEQGLSILGVELSPIAIQDFFLENHLEVQQRQQGKFTLNTNPDHSIQLLCGDFFDLSWHEIKDIKAIYDRAALVALPPEIRKRYSECLIDFLPIHSHMLLVSFEYDQSQMKGPPFSVTETEIRELFTNAFKMEMLEEADIIAKAVQFQEKGLKRFEEKIYLLTRT